MLVAGAIVVLLAGIGVGLLLRPESPKRPSPAAVPATTVQPPVVTRLGPAPPSCLAALDDAEATISYLVNHIRDDRLTRSLAQYQVHRNSCRTAGG
jgi:hypothetical protein